MDKKTNQISLSFILLLLLLGPISCEQVDSSNIETNGIYSKIEASANGAGATNIKVRLTLGSLSNTVLDLSDDDQLIATAGGQSKQLVRDSSIIGDIKYKTSFNIGNAAGTKFQISLYRNGGINAPNSIARLPEPFNIEMPSPGDGFIRDDDIVLVWSPGKASGNKFLAEVSADCGYVRSNTSLPSPVDSAGKITYKASMLIPQTLRPDATCVAQITLIRQASGTLHSNLDGGYYRIKQKRSVTIHIAP